MKKIGDLMLELGFSPDAPDSVKEAFIRHLIYVSTGERVSKHNKIIDEKNGEKRAEAQSQQLNFNFDDDKKAI